MRTVGIGETVQAAFDRTGWNSTQVCISLLSIKKPSAEPFQRQLLHSNIAFSGSLLHFFDDLMTRPFQW